MMKNLALTVALAFNITPAKAASESIVNELLKYQKTAENKKFDYLPIHINHQFKLCTTEESEDNCLRSTILFAEAVFTCEENPVYQNQMASYDHELFSDILKTKGKAQIPQEIKERLELIKKAAIQLNPKLGALPWKYNAYNAPDLNAHAGADSQIVLSSGLWAPESPLNLDEVTAIIAHEVSHIFGNDSLKMGCLSLEWANDFVDMKTAMIAFREEFSLNSERGESWQKHSQSIEYNADKLGVKLLKTAGLDPRLMGDALEKLKPKNGGSGFSTGSHPEVDKRVEAAYQHAHNIQ